MTKITVTPGTDRATVAFAYDKALLADFKAAFPTAKFDGSSKAWTVAGKTAAKRVQAWVAGREQSAQDAAMADEIAAQRMSDEMRIGGAVGINGLMYSPGRPYMTLAEHRVSLAGLAHLLTPLGATLEAANGRRAWRIPASAIPALREIAPEVDARIKAWERAADERTQAAVAEVKAAITGRFVACTAHEFAVTTPYDDALVAAIKAIPGARWDKLMRRWSVPLASAAALRDALPGIEARAAEVQARVDAEADAARAARAKERAALEARRFPTLARRAPRPGDVLRYDGKLVCVESVGKAFRADEEAPSVWGEEWLGNEGEWAVYVYFRPATAEGADRFLRAEAEANARREAVAAARKRLAGLEGWARKEGELPKGRDEKVTEVLLESGSVQVRLVGGGSSWEITPDALWHVERNGMDGDDWSRNNIGGGIGHKLPRSPEIEAELRRIAVVLGEKT